MWRSEAFISRDCLGFVFSTATGWKKLLRKVAGNAVSFNVEACAGTRRLLWGALMVTVVFELRGLCHPEVQSMLPSFSLSRHARPASE